MSNLALFLQNFYLRHSNRIIFNNGMSLNEFALEMWQIMGEKDMDASTLSKIINGKRIFNNLQLKTFCNLLQINDWDRIKIERLNLISGKKECNESLFLSTNGLDYLFYLIDYGFDLLYLGDCDQLKKLTSFIDQRVHKSNQRHNEVRFLNLYLKGRLIGNLLSGPVVLSKTLPIVDEMRNIPLTSTSTKKGLINTLEGNCHYIRAEYYSSDSIQKGITFVKESLEENFVLSEKIFSYRNLIALSLLTKDEQLIKKSLTLGENFIQQTAPDNNTATALLHLGGSIAHTKLFLGDLNSFSLLELYKKEFKTGVEDQGNYTMSNIKNEIKMYTLINETKHKHFKKLLSNGLKFSNDKNYPRYVSFLNKVEKATTQKV